MSDLEYDMLDELYFIQPFRQLKEALDWDDDTLRDTLQKLQEKGWLKCYNNPSEEIFGDEIDIPTKYRTYYYLASKDGLFAHNSIRHEE